MNSHLLWGKCGPKTTRESGTIFVQSIHAYIEINCQLNKAITTVNKCVSFADQRSSTWTSVSSKIRLVAAQFERSLAPARELSIAFRAYANSLHALRPIRMSHPACANQGAWVFVTLRRPCANSVHTAMRYAWTWTLSCHIVQKAVIFLIHFPATRIRLWP